MSAESVTLTVQVSETPHGHRIKAVAWGITLGRYGSIASATLDRPGPIDLTDREQLWSALLDSLHAVTYHS